MATTLSDELKKRFALQQPTPQQAADRFVSTGNALAESVPQPQAGPQLTPDMVEQRRLARGEIEPVSGLFGQLAQVPAQMARNANQFFGDVQRAATPEDQKQFSQPAAPSVGSVISNALDVQLGPSGERIASGLGIQTQPTPQPQVAPPVGQGTVLQEPSQVGQGTVLPEAPPISAQPATSPSPSPQGSGLTTVGGAPLSEFLEGGAMPEQGFAREQAGFLTDRINQTGSVFEQESEARQQRILEQDAARAQARSGEDTGTMSFNEARKSVPKQQGETTSAYNDRVNAFRQRGGQQMTEADRVSIEGEKLKNAKTAAEIQQIMSKRNAGVELTEFEKQVDRNVAQPYLDWKQGGAGRSASNIEQLSSVEESLREGNLDTRTLTDLLPAGNDWVRKLTNPSGSDAIDRIRGVAYQSLRETLGAQFTEKEGKNLVDTYFNPALGEEANADRLADFVSTLRQAHQAKGAMFEHLTQNGSMKGFTGQSGEDIIRGLGKPQGANGSPIKNDVNVVSTADDILSSGKY